MRSFSELEAKISHKQKQKKQGGILDTRSILDSVSPSVSGFTRSAAAQFGQEVGHAQEDPHHQEVRAERQQGQRVQEAGVQPEVPHRQQAAQVLLDHPLPRPNAAESQEVGARGGGVERQKKGGSKAEQEDKGQGGN